MCEIVIVVAALVIVPVIAVCAAYRQAKKEGVGMW